MSAITTEAASALADKSWTVGSPTVIKNVPVSSGGDSSCTTYRQEVMIEDYGASRNVCMYGDDHMKIASYSEDGQYRGAVGFAFSATMHVIEGICTMICRYSSVTDTLVTQQSVTGYGRGLVVYRHASERIRQVVSPPFVNKYVFDATKPDYEIKNEVGRYIWTPTFNISSNGEWIVAELYGKGTVLLDVDTLTARQITTSGPGYGYGMDPSEQLAVSNDGKSVVVTGDNSGFYVFDVTDDCGQPLIGDLTPVPGMHSCPSGDSGIHVLFPNFYGAGQPRFFDNGRELEVIATRWVEGPRQVIFGVSGQIVAHQLKLLSLGDSFSSGEGESDDAYYLPGTNQLFDTCHVSRRAYPALIAQSLGLHDGEARNLACSGATTNDIVGNKVDYWGQGNRLGVNGLKLSEAKRDDAKEVALNNFQPGRALQADFIERYNPEIITIGIGGNDAGLMGKLRTCAGPGTCEWAQQDKRKATADEIKRLADTLGSLFKHISLVANGAKVFVVGYPSIIDPDGKCDWVTGFLLDHTERLYIQNSIHYVDQVIRLATETAGYTYVDVEHSFDGKRLCSGASSLAMNGVRLGGDVAIIDSLPLLKIIGLETFHPTPIGHALVANTFISRYESTASNGNDSEVADASYWGEGTMEGPDLYHTDFVVKNETLSNHLTIRLSEGSLQPNSQVTVEIHSDTTVVATMRTDERGGVNGEVTLPPTVVAGFHSLHLLGKNRVGEAIDIYQFLTVGNEGEAIGTNNENVVKNNPMLYGQTDTSEVASSVLGSETIHGEVSTSNGQKTVVSTATHRQQRLRIKPSLVIVGASGLVAVMIPVGIILLRRRWSKPSS